MGRLCVYELDLRFLGVSAQKGRGLSELRPQRNYWLGGNWSCYFSDYRAKRLRSACM